MRDWRRAGTAVAVVGFNLESGLVQIQGGEPEPGSAAAAALAAVIVAGKTYALEALREDAAKPPPKVDAAKALLCITYGETGVLTLFFGGALAMAFSPPTPAPSPLLSRYSTPDLLFSETFFGGNKSAKKIGSIEKAHSFVPTGEMSTAICKQGRDLNKKEIILCLKWLQGVNCQCIQSGLLAFLADAEK